MSTILVEKTIRIFQDDFAYGVRPNDDTGGVDIFYEEGNVEQKYIAVSREALEPLMLALSEFVELLP